MRSFRTFLITGLLLATRPVLAQSKISDAIETQAPGELGEVVVSGEQPGPAFWRVTSGDHVLWLLGEVPQLPAEVTWRSNQLQTVLVDSQEVLLDGGIHWGPRTKHERTAVRSVTKLPDGKTLQEILSPELYMRVDAARRTFISNEKEFEQLQPIFAANRLIMNSMRPLGLRFSGASVAVSGLSKKAGIRVTRTESTWENFSVYVRALENGSTTPCLEGAVAILADGGSGVRALANAWAVGDIQELRRLVPQYAFDRINPQFNRCKIAVYGSEKGATDIAAEHAEKWLTAVDRSLAAKKSTVALVPMGELFAPDGYLAALRARGYEVAEPQ